MNHDASSVGSVRGLQGGLAAAAAIAAGSVAYGTPVRFENDGSFRWDENFLDVTSPVHKQTGLAAGAASFEHLITREVYDSYCGWYFYYNTVKGAYASTQVDSGWPNGAGIDRHSRGGVIPFDVDTWRQDNEFGFYYMGGLLYWTDWGAGYGMYFPGYIGVRFELPTGTHYGWIMTHTEDSGPGAHPSMLITALAWGYETEPFTPIEAGAVPAPGALAVLAMGAAAGATRGQRADGLARGDRVTR